MLRNVVIFFAALLLLGACKKDKEDVPGFLEGVVTAKASGDPLEGVRILVFDANTNAPVGISYQTDNLGSYSIEIDAGTYFLKLYKLGFNDIPGKGVTSLPITVPAGENVITNFEMTASEVTDGGIISGQVSSEGNGVSGVLVVAENDSQAFSSVSDGDGNYFIFNVIPGTYQVSGWKSEYNSGKRDVSVTNNQEVTGVDLDLTKDAMADITGSITFLATENIEVDISLVHPLTRETIPGLSSFTTNYKYIIPNVPEGTYLARASFANDTKVMDPDWIVKNGEPYITISADDAILDFSITGAVTLLSPTNNFNNVVAIEIPVNEAVFSWEPYPSASDYVIEVSDPNGDVIWGGFSENWTIKNTTIPSLTTSVEFNFDQTAKEMLQSGKVYRWKIYASKDDKQSSTGWRLISASEDQMGLFKIKE